MVVNSHVRNMSYAQQRVHHISYLANLKTGEVYFPFSNTPSKAV